MLRIIREYDSLRMSSFTTSIHLMGAIGVDRGSKCTALCVVDSNSTWYKDFFFTY